MSAEMLVESLVSSLCDEEDALPQECTDCGPCDDDAGGPAYPQHLTDLLSRVADLCQQQAQIVQGVQSLSEYCTRTGVPEVEVAAALQQGHGISLAELQSSADLLRRGIEECRSEAGWQLVTDGGAAGLTLWYRHEPGSTVHCFKAKCMLDAPMEEPLSMAREFDLVSSWATYLTTTTILQVTRLMEVLTVYAALWVPWPLAQRDVVMQAIGCDMLSDEGCVAIAFVTPDQLPEGAALPEGSEGRCRVKVLPGSCLMLEPAAAAAGGDAGRRPSRSAALVAAHVDAGVPHVPEALITFILKVFAPFMHSTIVRTLAGVFGPGSDSPLVARMQQRPGLYGMIRDRVRAYLAARA